MILWTQPPPWKITPSTKLNPHLHLKKLQTPTYTIVLKKPLTPTRVGGRNYIISSDFMSIWMSAIGAKIEVKNGQKYRILTDLEKITFKPKAFSFLDQTTWKFAWS